MTNTKTPPEKMCTKMSDFVCLKSWNLILCFKRLYWICDCFNMVTCYSYLSNTITLVGSTSLFFKSNCCGKVFLNLSWLNFFKCTVLAFTFLNQPWIICGLERRSDTDSRVRWVYVMNGNSSLDAAQCKTSRFTLLVFKNSHTAVLINKTHKLKYTSNGQQQYLQRRIN